MNNQELTALIKSASNETIDKCIALLEKAL